MVKLPAGLQGVPGRETTWIPLVIVVIKDDASTSLNDADRVTIPDIMDSTNKFNNEWQVKNRI